MGVGKTSTPDVRDLETRAERVVIAVSRAYLLRLLSVPTAEPVPLIGALYAHAEFLPFRDLQLEEDVPTSAAVVAELRRLERDDYLHSLGSGTMGRHSRQTLNGCPLASAHSTPLPLAAVRNGYGPSSLGLDDRPGLRRFGPGAVTG